MAPEKRPYAALVAEAVEAVAAVKDPELRSVAFEKILATLLEGQTGPARKRRPNRDATARNEKGVSLDRPSGKKRHGPKGSVEALIDEGFFKKQRTIAEVKAELANAGRHIAMTSLSGPLQTLTQERRLRRQKVATKTGGTKTTYAYSEW